MIPNSRLPHVARSGRAEIGDLQQLGPGVSRIVNRMPVYEGGAVVGAVGQVSFSGVEALNRMQQRLNQLHDEVQHYKRELSQLRGGTPTAQMVGASAPCKGWPARSTPWRGWTCPCSSWARAAAARSWWPRPCMRAGAMPTRPWSASTSRRCRPR